MNKSDKAAEVQDLQEKFAKATGVIITEYRGLSVAAIQTVRNDFRKEQVEYRVVKNTLAQRAIKGTSLETLTSHFDGPVAVAIAFGDPVAAAKVAVSKAKEFKELVLKQGYTDGQLLPVDQMSSLPSKEDVRAALLAMMQAGPQSFLQMLNAGPQNFLYLLKAREKALAEAGETK
jgi:large subunit ribosomal protein L10